VIGRTGDRGVRSTANRRCGPEVFSTTMAAVTWRATTPPSDGHAQASSPPPAGLARDVETFMRTFRSAVQAGDAAVVTMPVAQRHGAPRWQAVLRIRPQEQSRRA
jgi:hypothetical protein